MTLICYSRMRTNSRRAMRKLFHKGKKHYYNPRSNLLLRLQEELREINLNLTIDEVYAQIKKERRYLLEINYGLKNMIG